MTYTVKSELLEVTVNDLGAELSSVKFQGKEKLWQNETGEWAGKAPILFPVCGRCSMIVEGTEYPIPFHGVAKKSVFALTEQTENSLSFTLSSSEETKKVYPFDFEFTITYTVNGAELEISFEVYNPAEKALYFSCGSHESYVLDKEISEYKLVAEKEEEWIHSPYEDKLTDQEVFLAKGKELPLPEDILSGSNTLIMSGLRSGGVSLCEKSGKKVVDISFKDFSNLLLWRPGNVKMVCIEPWSNLPDRAADEKKEFSQKAGVLKVEPNESKTIVRTIMYY